MVWHDGGIPADFTRPRIETNYVCIIGIEDDEILVNGQAAHLCAGPTRIIEFSSILPDEVSGARIERLYDVPWICEIHHAVMDQWRGLRTTGFNTPGPSETDVCNVGPINLVERTVTPSIERSAPVKPITWIRILQSGIGDRCYRRRGLRL